MAEHVPTLISSEGWTCSYLDFISRVDMYLSGWTCSYLDFVGRMNVYRTEYQSCCLQSWYNDVIGAGLVGRVVSSLDEIARGNNCAARISQLKRAA